MLTLYTANCEALEKPDVFEQYLPKVPEERREHVMHCRSPRGRALRLGAGLLLIRAVTDCGISAADAAACVIARNKYGKPYFEQEELRDRYFSLSHSGCFALCAFSDSEVGADIQKIGRVNLKTAKKFMHENEYEAFCRLPESEQTKMFYRLWAMKEAYLKYTGSGFFVQPSSVEIASLPHSFTEVDIAQDYMSAVCCENSELPVCHEVNFFIKHFTN